MSWQNAGNDEVEVDFWKLEAHLISGEAPCVPPLYSLAAALLGRDPGEQEFRSYNSAAFQLASPSARQADGATGRGSRDGSSLVSRQIFRYHLAVADKSQASRSSAC